MPREEIEELIRTQLKNNYFGEDSNDLSSQESYHRQNDLEFGVRNILRCLESCGFIEQQQSNESLEDKGSMPKSRYGKR